MTQTKCLAAFVALLAVVLAPARAAAQSESAGVNQYFSNCASCHESNDPGHQAPKTAVLKQMTPERILEVMMTGSMRNAAANVSDADLWQFDSAQEFKTVNGVAARGGSAASGGPVVADGMVFIGSGYPGFQGGQPGNVLLAFSPAVRLDVHADELIRKAESTTGGR